MKKETRIKYIEAMSSEEFERKMNDALKGLCEPKIQIYGKYEGAIIYTEHIYEEEKTIEYLKQYRSGSIRGGWMRSVLRRMPDVHQTDRR